ncbi:biotin transporter BioY [Lichenihabitans psoromatis]|uniref:biotin transporter BioY n=1 Tax=Lichenihabitans psoromatis TaxID=2528642 RepID=UPI0010383EA7|nr:biotin transporter BioY [Lichenihabitans psoromatis]
MSSSSQIRVAVARPTSIGALRALASIAIGSALLALAAHVAVPFWPVPITLQTLVVLGLGMVLGPSLGVATVLAYLLEGLAGLPVFAHGAGLATLLGPTGGYLIGYVAAAGVAGLAARRGWLTTPVSTLAALAAADAIVFAIGVPWLAALIGWDRAIAVGLVPFLLGEALKLALLTAAAQLWFGARRA